MTRGQRVVGEGLLWMTWEGTAHVLELPLLLGLFFCVPLGLTLCDPVYCSHQAPLSLGFSPSKNTGVGCHFLLQGSSRPRDGIPCWVSCTGRQIVDHCATWEAQSPNCSLWTAKQGHVEAETPILWAPDAKS